MTVSKAKARLNGTYVHVPKQKHFRCDARISFKDVSEGYYAQCPSCDEDLFSFEVV